MKNKQSGQIMIVAIILLGIFTTIGLSVATQVAFEQQKAILEEKTQQAYFAAESGIEKALQSIFNGSEPNGTQISVGKATVYLEKVTQGGVQTYKVPYVLNSGQNYSLSLGSYTAPSISICWDKADTSFLAVLLYSDSSGSRQVKNFSVNTSGSQTHQISGSGDDLYNGSPSVTTITNGSCGTETSFTGYKVSFNLDEATVPGINQPFSSGDYITIIPMYQSNIQFYFDSGLPTSLIGEQGSEIKARAEVSELKNKVIRTVRYFLPSFAPPPAYLLFSVYGANTSDSSRGVIEFGDGKNW
jgi:Tfp pilus assembly protein PilX